MKLLALRAAKVLSFSFVVFCSHFLSIAGTQPGRPPARVETLSGFVQTQAAGKQDWYAAAQGQPLVENDRLRTMEDGRAIVEMRDLSRIRLNPRSEMLVTPARSASAKGGVTVVRGLLYFLHRNQPKEIDIETPFGTAAIEGTEFVLEVQESGTTVSMVDGRVELFNEFGRISLSNGEQGIMAEGQAPRKTAVIDIKHTIQWSLYYPGILDAKELGLDEKKIPSLSASIVAYKAGDLVQALALFPKNQIPETTEERLYLAGLKLSCGQVSDYHGFLATLDESHLLGDALRLLVAAVQQQITQRAPLKTASQWLASSYYFQSLSELDEARKAAQVAVEISPDFGFAWARLAELEFSSGHTEAAHRALSRALAVTPRNAQAHALNGFLHLARHDSDNAMQSFDIARKIDPMLGNAWLGSGLQKINEGRSSEGRADLQVAAIVEPNRWLLRSYLGKAYAHEALFSPVGRTHAPELRALAEKELGIAKKNDPLDPTAWLYSALFLNDQYRTAEAIHDLEQSARLNDNRQIYRSRLMLDQDQAVRSANLANIFEDAEMRDVSVREAAHAVAFDYANFSAHLHLANSYNLLRDPTRFNLRHESEWFNEHLLSSMLSPVGAGSLSHNLSHQEYSRLFDTKQFGFSGSTEYFSSKELRQKASHVGTVGKTAYALDLDYHYKDGIRPNNDLSRLEWYSRVKQQVTPHDSLLLLVKYQDYDAGDNFQYYDPDLSTRPDFRFEESQTPGMLLGGWHHEWSPGVHSLFLGGRLANDQKFRDVAAGQLVQVINPVGVLDPLTIPLDVMLNTSFEIYSAEFNQIVQRTRHTDIFGVRVQHGDVEATSLFDNPAPALAPLFSLPVATMSAATFQRLSTYAYHHWEILDNFMLIGGLAHDAMTYPSNYRRPPLGGTDEEKEQLSPKAGLIWQVAPKATLRGMYSRAVGGMSYDESVRLEPTQIAGFGQSFRSIASESLIGSIEGAEYTLAGAALDFRLWTNSWVSVRGHVIESEIDRDVGILSFDILSVPPITTSMISEQLSHQETTAGIVFNQIVGDTWFIESDYSFSRSELVQEKPRIAASPTFQRMSDQSADLHQVKLSTTWRPPSGFFTRGEWCWYSQDLRGTPSQPEGDSFAQLHLFGGYRFPRRAAEITLGVLNVTEENYKLSPLNYYVDLPRDRLFYARFRFSF